MSVPASQRVHEHRSALRASGLRPVQLWVPDTRSTAFADECRRQSELLRDAPGEGETTRWLARVADRDGWE